MASGTFTVAGKRVRTSSNRRFVCWRINRGFDGVRHTAEIGSMSIFKRSDSVANINAAISRYGFSAGSFYVVIDTATGEEVK